VVEWSSGAPLSVVRILALNTSKDRCLDDSVGKALRKSELDER
jgi:hypothetical protein